MARQLGIQRTQWIKYENGETAPGAEIIARICRVHACSADWLLGLNDNFATRGKVEARAGAGGIAIAGSWNRVTGVVAGAPVAAACAKCPYKKKLKALEKVLNK